MHARCVRACVRLQSAIVACRYSMGRLCGHRTCNQLRDYSRSTSARTTATLRYSTRRAGWPAWCSCMYPAVSHAGRPRPASRIDPAHLSTRVSRLFPVRACMHDMMCRPTARVYVRASVHADQYSMWRRGRVSLFILHHTVACQTVRAPWKRSILYAKLVQGHVKIHVDCTLKYAIPV